MEGLVDPTAIIAVLALSLGGALSVGFFMGAGFKLRAITKQRKTFEKLTNTVQTYQESDLGKEYTRGYGCGYEDCMANVSTFLLLGKDER